MSEKVLKIGLGDALSRMLKVEMDRRARVLPPKDSMNEVSMIVEALNAHSLTLSLSCESEPGVEGVEVFKKSIQTSCCRIDRGTKTVNGSRS
tara:strand:- start:1613 stop:1888 length:276 start_codon:yes stop_codon:yes gene_type:complete